MKQLILSLIEHFKKLEYINETTLHEGGNIFYGDELQQNSETLNITVNSISDVQQVNGGYHEGYEISLVITWIGNLNHTESQLRALEINNHIKVPNYSRDLHKKISSLEVGTMTYSDKIEDWYVFSMDLTVYWRDSLL